jgi:hypothetical protein
MASTVGFEPDGAGDGPQGLPCGSQPLVRSFRVRTVSTPHQFADCGLHVLQPARRAGCPEEAGTAARCCLSAPSLSPRRCRTLPGRGEPSPRSPGPAPRDRRATAARCPITGGRQALPQLLDHAQSQERVAAHASQPVGRRQAEALLNPGSGAGQLIQGLQHDEVGQRQRPSGGVRRALAQVPGARARGPARRPRDGPHRARSTPGCSLPARTLPNRPLAPRPRRPAGPRRSLPGAGLSLPA